MNLRQYNIGGFDAFTYGVELIKATTNQTYAINAFVDELSVWESLFAKAMQAKLFITDGKGLIEQIALQPGDMVHIVMYKGEDAEKKIDKRFEIMSIQNGQQTINRQGRSYMLSCVTAPAMLNKVRVVNRALSGKISDMVRTVANDYLGLTDVDIEETDGDKKNVVMPGYRPFKMLQWLANHAVSVEGGVSNSFYMFWEDRDGFRFKSLRRIISDATTHEYTMTGTDDRSKGKEDFYRIISHQQNRISNQAWQLDGGMLENEIMEFDIINRKITSSKFNFKDNGKELQLLSKNSVIDTDNNFEKLRQESGKRKGAIDATKLRSNEEAYGEINTYGRKHGAMVAQKQMFNQISYSFAMGGDANIKAGDLIDVISSELSSVEEKEMDVFLNGKFLIGNVRHRIIATKEYTTCVDVFKDGYDTAYKPKDSK